ncbi:hypothetical protein IF2G_02962 [Cordyceps javanica]|nr:hypothetical protein IF2G_02962 [Cordyceps javanica]
MVYPRHCKCYAKAAFFLFKTSTRGCVRSPLRVATPTCRQNDQLRGYWAAMQFCFQACLSDMRNSRQENKACHAPDMREHCINIWGPHGQHPALAHKSSWGSGVFAATLADRNLTGGAGVSTNELVLILRCTQLRKALACFYRLSLFPPDFSATCCGNLDLSGAALIENLGSEQKQSVKCQWLV